MAETEKIEKKAVLLTGIDELSPKLAALRAKVDGFKTNLEQAGMGKLDISGLFKGGSVVTPFVEGIKSAAAFQGKLAEVGETAKSVDVPSVPKSAAQNLNVFSASMDKVSVAVDAALLPAVSAVVVGLEPLLNGVGTLLNDNPELVQGIAAGAIAFSAIQSAVTGASQALDLMSTVLKTSPLMLIAMGIALVAGVIVANWKPISAFFAGLWQEIAPVVMPMVEFFKTMFAFTPLGLIINNWGPISQVFAALWDVIKAAASLLFDAFKVIFSWTPLGMIIANWRPVSSFFSSLWQEIKAVAVPVIDFFKTLFSWTPLGMIVSNWQPLVGLFSAIWDLLRALSVPVVDFFKGLFDWSPMAQVSAAWEPLSEFFSGLWDSLSSVTAPVGELFKTLFDWSPMQMITEHWTPIIAWFSGLWEKLKAIIEPIKDLFGGSVSGFIAKITGKVEGLTEAQQKTNAEGKGELAPAFFGASNDQASLSSDLPKGSNALVQQSAANNRAQLEGGLTVRFENAPAGMRTDQPQTNQPGLAVTSQIGYRSLSLGGSNELA
ncbi:MULTISPECIES: phage tail protein [unclassified Pseudomonas]|uniref:phage tail protein n=1 Tax=unclassified Pseudomonas TaxID=196821 RepID=UPI000CD2C615|nr:MULTISPECIES: phage tail protein [unclassified Pseudomonas]POA33035.1 phage tail protein [Pseudomonas sp. GW456-R21]POA69543.1 phage tail protein [Pseudomonas sp. GW460-R15]